MDIVTCCRRDTRKRQTGITIHNGARLDGGEDQRLSESITRRRNPSAKPDPASDDGGEESLLQRNRAFHIYASPAPSVRGVNLQERFIQPAMKVAASLGSAKNRHADCQIVKRKGTIYAHLQIATRSSRSVRAALQAHRMGREGVSCTVRRNRCGFGTGH